MFSKFGATKKEFILKRYIKRRELKVYLTVRELAEDFTRHYCQVSSYDESGIYCCSLCPHRQHIKEEKICTCDYEERVTELTEAIENYIKEQEPILTQKILKERRQSILAIVREAIKEC